VFGGGQWILFGSVVEHTDYGSLRRGWTFDVATNTWTMIPPPPLGHRDLRSGVYAPSTNEFIVWGGETRDETHERQDYANGAAFNLATRTWRTIPDAPFEGSGAHMLWTGGKVLVLFPSTSKDMDGLRAQAHAATFDPVTDAWVALPTPTFAARVGGHAHSIGLSDAFGAIYRGDRSFEDGDYPDLNDGGYWDSLASRWVNIPAAPFASFERDRRDSMASWSGNGKLFVWGGFSYNTSEESISTKHNDGAVFDPLTGSWAYIPDAPMSPRSLAVAVWTGCDAIVYGGSQPTSPYYANSGMLYRP
jgi:hypothetical protein